MAGFVLIHGAWHGGWCFDPVSEILRAKGHKVIAPDLPGMGGDAEALRAVTLAGWAEFTNDICHTLRRELDGAPLILAGHSRGGVAVSAAAEADPTAMDGLAYICAMMVPNGTASLDLSKLIMGDDAPDRQASLGEIIADGAGWQIDKSVAGGILAQNSPPELVARQVERLVVEPTAPLNTTIEVTPERWGSKPRWFIECLQDRIMPIDGQRRLQALSPGTQIITLDADHSPFYSTPQDLADALIGISEALAP